jgi:RNA binding exosome subunit
VKLSYFVHSTEDAYRLNQAVCEALGIGDTEISKESLEGHYGNRLEFIKAHLIGRRAEEVVGRISSGLTESSRKELLAQLDSSMDEHDALYLRLDRQSIESGLSISDQEPIRVKIKPKFRRGGHEVMKAAFIEELKL